MKNKTKTKKELRKEKLEKKQKNQRTEDERLSELEPALNKILELGLSEQFEGVAKFYSMVEDFIENGNPFTGTIKVPEIQREFKCLLSNNKMHKLTIVLAVSK